MCWRFVVLLNLMAAVFETNTKSISIQNSTLKTSEILDQLYKETMLRFQIEKEVHGLSSKVADLEKTKTTHVKGRGFYAYVSKDMANPGSGHTIIYDVVMTNLGGGYNGHTGVYTVPIDGLYSFTWITRVSCSSGYTSELHVNNKIAGSVFIYCGYNSNAGNAVIEVRKGDSVFVRTLTGSGMVQSNTHGRTSFSGFLVS